MVRHSKKILNIREKKKDFCAFINSSFLFKRVKIIEVNVEKKFIKINFEFHSFLFPFIFSLLAKFSSLNIIKYFFSHDTPAEFL